MNDDGKRRPSRPRLTIAGSSASLEEAAAIAAALERFLSETAPVPVSGEPVSRWHEHAALEAVDAAGEEDWWGQRHWGWGLGIGSGDRDF